MFFPVRLNLNVCDDVLRYQLIALCMHSMTITVSIRITVNSNLNRSCFTAVVVSVILYKIADLTAAPRQNTNC